LHDKHKLKKRHLFDSYLVATMLTNKTEHLATINQKDFKVFEQIELVEWKE